MPKSAKKTLLKPMRGAAEILAADKRAAARKYKVEQVPTPALQRAIEAHGRDEFIEIEDVDGWLRGIGARA